MKAKVSFPKGGHCRGVLATVVTFPTSFYLSIVCVNALTCTQVLVILIYLFSHCLKDILNVRENTKTKIFVPNIAFVERFHCIL